MYENFRIFIVLFTTECDNVISERERKKKRMYNNAKKKRRSVVMNRRLNNIHEIRQGIKVEVTQEKPLQVEECQCVFLRKKTNIHVNTFSLTNKRRTKTSIDS